jgi:hypothetical protein
MDEHSAARATFLAELEANDAERAAAEQHVLQCQDCRDVLGASTSLLALVKRALRPPVTPDGVD